MQTLATIGSIVVICSTMLGGAFFLDDRHQSVDDARQIELQIAGSFIDTRIQIKSLEVKELKRDLRRKPDDPELKESYRDAKEDLRRLKDVKEGR